MAEKTDMAAELVNIRAELHKELQRRDDFMHQFLRKLEDLREDVAFLESKLEIRRNSPQNIQSAPPSDSGEDGS